MMTFRPLSSSGNRHGQTCAASVRVGGVMIERVSGRVVAALVGAALIWPALSPSEARAQDSVPVIGFLNSGSPGPFAPLAAAFRASLAEGGFVEGRNLRIEYRWAEGQYDRLPGLAADLVSRKVTLIAATGGTVSARAAKTATSTIPILFVGGANPVAEGLVESFNRPGGNATGVSTYTSELLPKRLELLRELVPNAKTIALLMNPNNSADVEMQEMASGPQAKDLSGVNLLTLKASSEDELEGVFAAAAAQHAEALLVSADPFFNSRRNVLVGLAARYRIPAGYSWREYALAGGLMSYGTSIAGMYRQIGQYVVRVLKGEKPGDLPVQNPTKFEMLINLKAAKELGLTVPRIMLAGADEIVE
jgi:putative tryptophan/tyrosine transport system substrate-binding protein